MSNRNDYNYFDLDNFDDNYDSRDYRRRQPQRRQTSYGRPTYNTGNRRGGRNNKRRTRNRIIIVSAAILILILFVVLLSVIFKGCSGGTKNAIASVSTETKSTVSSQPTTVQPTQTNDDLSPSYFVTPTIKDDNTMGTSAYSIYVWNKVGYELFGSDDQRAQTYADTIKGFADKLPGVKVYDMVIPNHTEMGLPQRLKDSEAYSTSQAENIKAMYSHFANSNVTPINAYNYIANHNSEYIYFGSDHHWTGLGAYYAYSAFAKTNNLDVLSLQDCTEKTIEGFTGTFTNTASGLDADTVHYWEFPYDVTMEITDENGSTNTYDSPYYQYAEAGTLTYGVFIMGDNAKTVLKSSSEHATPGKKIAVIKESYGNAFVPYLTYNYDEVHIIDFRSYNGNLPAYCQENGIDEVLFLNGVMSANTQIQLDSMSGLFN